MARRTNRCTSCFPGEPDAAVRLQRLAGQLRERVAHVRPRHGDGFVAVGHVIGERERGVMRRGSGALELDEEVRELVLDRLEAADRAPELHAVLGVLHGSLEQLVGGADRSRRLQDRGELQRAADHGLCVGPVSEDVVALDPDAGEPHFAEAPGEIEPAEDARPDAGGAGRYEHVRESRGSPARNEEQVGDVRVLHEPGEAVEQPAVAPRARAAVDGGRGDLDRREVRTAVGRQAPGRDRLTAGDRRQEPLALVVGPRDGDRVGDDVAGQKRAGVQHAPELLRECDRVDHGLAGDAAAFVLLGDEHGGPAQRRTLAPDRTVERRRLLEVLAHRAERMAVGEEPPRAVAQQQLVLGEREVHSLRPVVAQYSSRRIRLNSFPPSVRGNASRKSTERGHL